MEATKHLCDGWIPSQLDTKDFNERLHVLRLIVDLHADDGVDEEEHGDEQDDVGERLEGLDEGPEKDPVHLKVICFAILTTTTMVFIISHP